MTTLQYIASIVFLGLGGLIAFANSWVLLKQLRCQSSPSAVPLIGGIFLFAGALLLPGGILRPWAVTGLFLDYGFLPYSILCGVSLIQETRRHAEKHRILSLQFESDTCTGEIFVYPGDECIYKWAARDGLSSGSMVMKVDSYIPNKALKLSIQEIAICLGVHGGTWQLEFEQGWRNPMHSLANSTLTPTATRAC